MRIYFILLLLFSSFVSAEIISDNSVSYYPISFTKEENSLRALNAASPIKVNGKIFHAYTKWNVSWKIWWYDEGTSGFCRLTKTQVNFTSNILLPKFPSDVLLDNKTNLYLIALKRHEEGHVAYGRAASEEIERSIKLIPPAPSCSQLLELANQRGRSVLEIYKQKEINYDIETKHGVTQGALLRP